MKTSAGLSLFEWSLHVGMLFRGMDGKKDTHTCICLNTNCFPAQRAVTEAALPVTVVAIILQALSTDRLLQVSTLLTTSLSKHTLTHTHKYKYCTCSHAWAFSSTIRSAQANGSSEWRIRADILLKRGETHIIKWRYVLAQACIYSSFVVCMDKCVILGATAKEILKWARWRT